MPDKLEITKEAVLMAAGTCDCGTAKEVLKKLFPEAFVVKEEWEDVTRIMEFGPWTLNDGEETVGVWDNSTRCPFLLCVNNRSVDRDNYKIEEGRIWRKKSR